MTRSPPSMTTNFTSCSSFSQACSLLNQYLKEKCLSNSDAFAPDFNLGIAVAAQGSSTATPLDTSSRQTSTTTTTTMNLFPEQAGVLGLGSPAKANPAEDAAAAAAAPHQMTIFYDGQVVVFNNLPADKAKEIMDLASRSSCTPTTSDPIMIPNSYDHTNAAAAGTTRSSMKLKASSDLPIARKASLHRFLEKRKDRMSVRGPYISCTNGSINTDCTTPRQHHQQAASAVIVGTAAGVPQLMSTNELVIMKNSSLSSSWLGLA